MWLLILKPLSKITMITYQASRNLWGAAKHQGSDSQMMLKNWGHLSRQSVAEENQAMISFDARFSPY
jgi:hypothetical protein